MDCGFLLASRLIAGSTPPVIYPAAAMCAIAVCAVASSRWSLRAVNLAILTCALASLNWIFSASYCWLIESICLDSLDAAASSALSVGRGLADAEPATEAGTAKPRAAAMLNAAATRLATRPVRRRLVASPVARRLECQPSGERSTLALLSLPGAAQRCGQARGNEVTALDNNRRAKPLHGR